MDPRWKVKDSLREAWDVPDELLRAIGAEPDWLTRWPNELSGGQLQRLSILRALSPQTRVLIADEITAFAGRTRPEQTVHALDALLEARKALEGNVAPQLALEAMLLGLGRASHC